jgi:hypothetical protein
VPKASTAGSLIAFIVAPRPALDRRQITNAERPLTMTNTTVVMARKSVITQMTLVPAC